MRGKRAAVRTAICVTAAGAAALILAVSYNALYNTSKGNTSVRSVPGVEGIYKVSFAMPKTSAGSAFQYTPRYSQNDADTAIYYAGLFGMGERGAAEDEEAFTFSAEGETLTVYKYVCRLAYERKPAGDEPGGEPEVDGMAVRALEFLKERGMAGDYMEVRIQEESGGYAISFADRLNGRASHAFMDSVTLDVAGNVLGVECYFYDVDRLAEVGLKNVGEAMESLPDAYEAGTRIDLKKYSLVYICEDSIIQPAYLFEGETNGGAEFSYYVNASVYDREAED